MRNLYFGYCMLEVICGNRQMKNLEKCRYNILKHICIYIATFCFTIIKIQSFTTIIDYYSFMGNLYFDCSMLEVISGNFQMKKIEKYRYNNSEQNSSYRVFFLKNYKKLEFCNKPWWLELNGKLLFWLLHACGALRKWLNKNKDPKILQKNR